MTFHDLHSNETPLLLPKRVGRAIRHRLRRRGVLRHRHDQLRCRRGGRAPRRRLRQQGRDYPSCLSLAGLPAYVSADIEDGYSDDPGEVGGYVAAQGWAFDRAGAIRAERGWKPVGFPSAVVCPGRAQRRRGESVA
jgi:hypothetical protein